MSINFISGKPGGGKSMYAVRLLINELRTTKRDIVTNLPLKLPELAEYMEKEFGDTFNMIERIERLSDDEIGTFWLHRGRGRRLEKRIDRELRGRKLSVVDYTQAAEWGGVFYAIDEIHIAFNSRKWQETGEDCIYFLSQHRKLGDEWFLTAQNTKQIETSLRQLAQDFWLVRNHGKMRVGPFRQPDMMTITIYDKAPTDGNSVVAMERRAVRLDKKGLGSCFDTSGGTGVVGGRSADLLERKRGVPFYALIVVAILALVALVNMPNFAGMAAAKVFNIGDKSAKPKLGPAPSAENPPIPSKTNSFFSLAAGNLGAKHESKVQDEDKPPVVMFAGSVWTGGGYSVLLSNGRIIRVKQGFSQLPNGDWWVDGIVYPEAIVPPSTNEPAPVVHQPLPTQAPAAPVAEVQVHYFGRRVETAARQNPYRENSIVY